MPLLTIQLKTKQLNGLFSLAELNLKTFQPVTVTAVKMLSPSRLIICRDKSQAQTLMHLQYQMTDAVPNGVAFEIASNIIWSDFDLTQPPHKADQSVYLRYPLTWQPVTLHSPTGKLWCLVEARSGNDKHKASIKIDLTTL